LTLMKFLAGLKNHSYGYIVSTRAEWQREKQ